MGKFSITKNGYDIKQVDDYLYDLTMRGIISMDKAMSYAKDQPSLGKKFHIY